MPVGKHRLNMLDRGREIMSAINLIRCSLKSKGSEQLPIISWIIVENTSASVTGARNIESEQGFSILIVLLSNTGEDNVVTRYSLKAFARSEPLNFFPLTVISESVVEVPLVPNSDPIFFQVAVVL